MVNILERDWFGVPCPRETHTNPGTLAEFGAGFGVSMRQRAKRLAQLVSQPAFTAFIAAPQTYLNDVVPPSAALHERSP
jgi:hypothetical protein